MSQGKKRIICRNHEDEDTASSMKRISSQVIHTISQCNFVQSSWNTYIFSSRKQTSKRRSVNVQIRRVSHHGVVFSLNDKTDLQVANDDDESSRWNIWSNISKTSSKIPVVIAAVGVYGITLINWWKTVPLLLLLQRLILSSDGYVTKGGMDY